MTTPEAELLGDWFDLKEGRRTIDSGRFLTLFHADHSPVELARIFAGLPNAGELALRVQRARLARERRGAGAGDLVSEHAVELARSALASKCALLGAAGEHELVAIIARVEPTLCENEDRFQQAHRADWPNGEVVIAIADYLADQWHDVGPMRYALNEAFYGIGTDFDLAHYVKEPLLQIPMRFEPAMLLWEAGFDCALSETAFLVHRSARLPR